MCSLPAPAKNRDTGSILCKRCSALTFDDQIFRDYIKEHDNSSLPVFPYDGSVLVELNYEHTDLFPELPGLKASAQGGCTFCAALRQATLETTLPSPCRITYRLRYVWSPPGAQDFGLYMLLADLSVDDDKDGGQSVQEHKAGDNKEEKDKTTSTVKRSLAFVVESEGKKPNMLCSDRSDLVSKSHR